jgi:hypothetical protein
MSLFVKLLISFFPLFFRFGFLRFLFAEMMSDVKFVEYYHGVIFLLESYGEVLTTTADIFVSFLEFEWLH